MEELFKSPWLGVAVIAFAIVVGVWRNRGYLLAQGKRLASLIPGRTATTTADDGADLVALRRLCKRYKGDPEGKAAIDVLKARFLLVPGVSE
jgi:hypothetical protein